MHVQLDLNGENHLSAEATRSVVGTLQSLQARAEKAEAELAAMRNDLMAATERAERAEAALRRVQAAVVQALADLRE